MVAALSTLECMATFGEQGAPQLSNGRQMGPLHDWCNSSTHLDRVCDMCMQLFTGHNQVVSDTLPHMGSRGVSAAVPGCVPHACPCPLRGM